MSGHSKWSKIKHKKGAADAKRSNLFTKLLRAITLAARQGGGDPEMNFSLRLTIEKAKAGNVPKDKIDNAVKRGTGDDKSGVVFETITYEGFGPGQIGVMVEVVTDNKNRSSAEMKHVFSKHGGSLGGPGSVQWQFERLAGVHINKEEVAKLNSRDEFELNMIDAGVSDIVDEDEGVAVYGVVSDLQKIVEAVQAQKIEIEESGLEWKAKETKKISEAEQSKVENFFEAVDELDDVQEYFTNAV